MENKVILKKNLIEVTAYESKELGPVSLPDLVIHSAPKVKLTWNVDPIDGNLPEGFVCNSDGKMSGVIAQGSSYLSPYELAVVIQGEGLEPIIFTVVLTVLQSPDQKEGASPPIFNDKLTPEEKEKLYDVSEEPEFQFSLEEFAEYWTSFAEGEDLPNLEELLTRGVTEEDIYYLLSRFAALTVWNADDLRPADKGKEMVIENVSPKYRTFDFEVAIVGIPKELYGTNRTLADAVQTSKAMAQEARRRKWNVELTGFDKMVTAAWVEIEQSNAKSDYKMKVKNYKPTKLDYTVLSEVNKL